MFGKIEIKQHFSGVEADREGAKVRAELAGVNPHIRPEGQRLRHRLDGGHS